MPVASQYVSSNAVPTILVRDGIALSAQPPQMKQGLTSAATSEQGDIVLFNGNSRSYGVIAVAGSGTENSDDGAITKLSNTQGIPLNTLYTWNASLKRTDAVGRFSASGNPSATLSSKAKYEIALRNENANGLLRQYMPKGTDLSLLSPEDLRAIEDSLDERLRTTLGYRTPAEKYAEVVALST